jgi:REP-associated tyrosine transposase
MRVRQRAEEPGATYHVYSRGVDRRRIFVDDDDYKLYTDLLSAVVARQGWQLLGYCLMPNHVHLLVETPETNLGAGMQILHSRHAVRFNQRHLRTGHLFENRFRSPIVRSDEALVRLVSYVAMNPVAASLCKRAADWPWSSHALLEKGSVPRWLAHARLVERLVAIVGSDCYADLVATAEGRRYSGRAMNATSST